MPIHRKLLEVLVCPVTKLPVNRLSEKKLKRMNDLIREGKIKTMDGNLLREPLTEALVTSNRNMVYRVEEGIPIMLEDQGIGTHQIANW